MYVQQDGSITAFEPVAGRIFALGLTYASHIRETGEKPGHPAIFFKNSVPEVAPSAVALPSTETLRETLSALDPVLAGKLTRQLGILPTLLDYEVELGILLLEDVQPETATAPPRLGFFLANDITARSVQIAGQGSPRRLDFWSAAKSLPGFLPVGEKLWVPDHPVWDSLPDTRLTTSVNGELRQSATTDDIIFSTRQMLLFAARLAPERRLRAGDMILTGTPAGVAMSVPRWKRLLGAILPRPLAVAKAIAASLKNPLFLKPGDRLEFSGGWLGSVTVTIDPPPT